MQADAQDMRSLLAESCRATNVLPPSFLPLVTIEPDLVANKNDREKKGVQVDFQLDSRLDFQSGQLLTGCFDLVNQPAAEEPTI